MKRDWPTYLRVSQRYALSLFPKQKNVRKDQVARRLGAKATYRRPILGTCTTHERTYLLSPVLDTSVLHSKKRQLDKFASCHDQRSAILVSDAEFYVVKSVDMFEESTSC